MSPPQYTLLKLQLELRNVESELSRLYTHYAQRLQIAETRLRRRYHPLYEREVMKIQGVVHVLRRALYVAREALSAATESNWLVARLQLSQVFDKTKELLHRVVYGSVPAPLEVKKVVLKLYMSVEEALKELSNTT